MSQKTKQTKTGGDLVFNVQNQYKDIAHTHDRKNDKNKILQKGWFYTLTRICW